MGWTASHRFARISPRKARLVVDMIRGKKVADALNILRFADKRAAVFVHQVLKSAAASADEQEANVNRLVVTECYVDPGPVMKRFQPKDRGRAHPIKKRTSHIFVTVDEGAGR